MSGGLRRWLALDWRDRLLLCEALAMLACGRVAIRTLPFATIGRIATRGGARRPSEEVEAMLLRRVRWAILACARRVPFRALCFEQGLAAQVMLRRRGVASTLYYGAKLGAGNALKAHVWVRAGSAAVTGCGNSAEFAELVRFPAAPR